MEGPWFDLSPGSVFEYTAHIVSYLWYVALYLFLNMNCCHESYVCMFLLIYIWAYYQAYAYQTDCAFLFGSGYNQRLLT